MHSVGRLLFYRWPEKHACLADLLAPVHEVVQRCSWHIVFLKIPTGCGRGAVGTAEEGTGCAEYHLSAPTEEAAAVARINIARLFRGEPMLCKKDSVGTPRAAAAWLEGAPPVRAFIAGRDVELMDFVEFGEHDVLQALSHMANKMHPYLVKTRSGRGRSKADITQLMRALTQLEPGRATASNALLRRVLPVISQAKMMETPPSGAPSFAKALLDTSSERSTAKLRPGLGDAEQSVQSAIFLLLEELILEAGSTLRSGRARCPRTAYLRAPPAPRDAREGKGKGKGRQKSRKPKAQEVSKLVMIKARTQLECTLPRSNGKLSAMWIGRHDAVEEWMHGGWQKGAETPCALGTLRMVASTSPDGRTISASPPVGLLPDSSEGLPVPVPPGQPLRVIAVLLADMHEAYLIHETFRQTLRGTLSVLPAALCSAAREAVPAELHCADVLMRLILGLDVTRAAVSASSAADVAVEMAAGAAQSQTRRDLLRRVETMLMETLILMTATHNAAAKFLVVEPTREMCAAAVARLDRGLNRIGISQGVARVGYDEDRLNEQRAQARSVLRAVDHCVELLKRKCGTGREGAARQLICALLARRHAFLDQHHYSDRGQRRATILSGLRALVLTPAKLLELRTGKNELSGLLEDRGIAWALFADEMQRYSWKMVGAMGTGCSMAILTGDVDQARDPRGPRAPQGSTGSRKELATLRGGRVDSDELRGAWSSAANWIPLGKAAQTCKLAESFRLGAAGVALLQCMFPGRHSHMVSARGVRGGPEDCLVLLAPVERLRDWEHKAATSDIIWSPTFVRHCASILAVQLVVLLSGNDDGGRAGGIQVVSFLNGFLNEFKAFLAVHLSELCARAHEHLRLPLPPGGSTIYGYSSACRAKLLCISVALAAGGGDGPVEILQRHLQFIATSRYSKRLHVVVEDLRGEIMLPDNNSALSTEGVFLGLKQRWDFAIHSDYSEAQIQIWQRKAHQQMPWVRLIDFGEKEWTRLRVPVRFREAVRDDAAPPAFYSAVYWHRLQHPSIPRSADWEEVQQFVRAVGRTRSARRADVAARLQQTGQDAVETETSPDDEEEWACLDGSLKWNPDCAKAGDPPVFRTDVIQIFAEESDPDIDYADEEDMMRRGPPVEFLEERWPGVAVDAVCVHLRSETEVNISFPVAAELLLSDWEWAATAPATGRDDDPNWLVRHVSKTAWEFFKEPGRGKALLTAGAGIERNTRRRKKQLTTLGEDTFVLCQARSDRPAFCIDVMERQVRVDLEESAVGDEGAGDSMVETEWSHAYVAMGLFLQHSSQTALLARVYNLDLAVCFVKAVCRALRVCVRDGAIWASEDDAGRALRASFQLSLEEDGVPVDRALPGRPLHEIDSALRLSTIVKVFCLLF
ncbi:unnamed protein product [Prorocentrum cordatum]|uniref:Uncharacterized protein n=1 Tax=Prorocentrum cordatum TaxID=2364126 RepID=A0ABN9VGS8_9DINO|nr:unnamed protein product [Polarella glacialis]